MPGLPTNRSFARILALLGLFGYIIPLFSYLSPGSVDFTSQINPPTIIQHDLYPIQEVMQSCDRCGVRPDLCEIYGTKNVDLVRGYEGSGERWQRVMKRALNGEGIKMGVLGGSVSRGHGCRCDPWHKLVFKWWNETFPNPDNFHADGSVGARGSEYFKFCYREHMPSDVDVVLLEFGINDFKFGEKSFTNFETLLRSILELPTRPAVLIYHWLKIDGILATGADTQHGLAQMYDVPVINLRNTGLPLVIDDTEKEKIQELFVWDIFDGDGNLVEGRKDITHPSAVGHKMSADHIILYLEQQLCFLKNRPVVPPSSASYVTPDSKHVVDVLPRLRLTNRLDDPSVLKVESLCASVDSKTNPLQPLMSRTKGYELSQQSAEKWFWRGENVGDEVAEIAFEVETTVPEGEISIYILKSKKFSLGEADCWVDDENSKKTFIPSWWDNKMSIGQFYQIETVKLEPGKHVVMCRNRPRQDSWDESKGTAMNIIGLFVV